MKIKESLKKLETWWIHRTALKNMKKRYKMEIAALKISENYLTDLIIGYGNEDSQRAKWRDGLLQTQKDLLNLETLLKFLEKIK